MAAPFKLATLTDFTGGLNLRADQFALQPHESPDLLNVDIDPRGGVSLRGGSTLINDTPISDGSVSGHGLYVWTRTSGGTTIVAFHDGAGFTSSGGNFTAMGGDSYTANAGELQFASMRQAPNGAESLYIVGEVADGVRRWDGSSLDEIGFSSFNDNFENPSGGNIPQARCIATHLNYLFVGYTAEAATEFPNRIRWSHPGRPEDWRANDYIEVGSDEGDRIVKMLPFGDRLLIFKERSIWSLYGYDADSFGIQLLTDTIGAAGRNAVVETPDGVYVWDRRLGLHRIRSTYAEWLGGPILPALEDGRIDLDEDVYLAWGGRRVHASVGWGSERRLLVFDPSLNRRGAYMMHAYPLQLAHLAFHHGLNSVIAAHDDCATVTRLGVASAVTDDDASGDPVHIESYYTTSWLDASTPTVKKRWGRVRSVVRATHTSTLRVQVYHDYDSSSERRSFTIETIGQGDGAVWGAFDWGSEAWTPKSGVPYDIEKNSSMGSSSAVQLRVNGPTAEDAAWGISAITIPYRMRRFR